MKVSHEVPRCLLNNSREWNDYDYCLPHLLDQDEVGSPTVTSEVLQEPQYQTGAGDRVRYRKETAPDHKEGDRPHRGLAIQYRHCRAYRTQ